MLSVRCGDALILRFTAQGPRPAKSLSLYQTIEERILPLSALPIVVTSELLALKQKLNQRYGMAYIPAPGQHGA